MTAQGISAPSGIITRSGQITPFELEKIRSAIERAGKATNEFDGDEADLLAKQAFKVLAHRFADAPPHIEQIQDVVEQVLISANHFATARAYIVYREQRARLREDKRTVVEVESSMNEYLVARRLARQRQREPGLLARRADPQRLGQGRRELLAVARLPARGRPGAPRRRHPHPRPRHARRLLRRLVASHAAHRGPQRRARQGRVRPAEAPVERRGPDRELPRHAAERVGGCAGVQLASTRTWRRSSARTRCPTTRCASRSRSSSTTSTSRRAGARRRRSRTSRSTGPARRTSRASTRSSAARSRSSPTASCRPRWTSSTAPTSRS